MNIIKSILLILALGLSFVCLAIPWNLELSSEVIGNKNLAFHPRDNALALNVNYQEIKEMRLKLEGLLGVPLKFFTGWVKDGEAHVTIITPPDNQKLSRYISADRINQIAIEHDIQSADLKVMGLGSGSKQFGPEIGHTFFVIVKSEKLLQIRRSIHSEYLMAGGPATGPSAFAPSDFYPHITIGYTHEDIHQHDGLIKDYEHSNDQRFELVIVD